MSRPATWRAATQAQVVVEARLTARRGENLLAMVVIPVAVLLIVGSDATRDIGRSLLPAALVSALVASGMVNLGIATAYERGYGVLKRLGGSPLGRSGLVAAKLAVVLAISALQVVGLLVVATVVLGWRPGPDASLPALLVATLVGSAVWAGFGMAIAGSLRPEAALVLANVLFLAVLGLGGALLPLDGLPAPLAEVVRLSPFGALAEVYRSALGSVPGIDLGQPLLIVTAWAIAAVLLSVRTFRWD